MTAQKEQNRKDAYQKALAAYSQAMKAFHRKDYVKASEAIQAFLEKFPVEKELVDRAHLYLSICKSRLDKKKIELKNFEDFFGYGVYQLNLGNYEEAIKTLGKAHEKKPKEGKVLYMMANAYCLLGDEDECLEHLKKAVKLDNFYSVLAQNESDFEVFKEDKRFALITKMA